MESPDAGIQKPPLNTVVFLFLACKFQLVDKTKDVSSNFIRLELHRNIKKLNKAPPQHPVLQ